MAAGRLLLRPLKTWSITVRGTSLTTMLRVKMMAMTPPTLISRLRTPAATPRRSGATLPMIRLELGELNRPLPTPATSISTAISR